MEVIFKNPEPEVVTFSTLKIGDCFLYSRDNQKVYMKINCSIDYNCYCFHDNHTYSAGFSSYVVPKKFKLVEV